ncbi:diguanylate cyclase [Thiorhodococcus mannitoliphagus]|uniref:diguanylate cyclase n=1 Tax=Thiorhodococcus mannitoliphagus TaxID=329406 RepID=A0A6P1DQQ4_9GAMM|nr:GGDEF domain-containing protein [Thiorhodococcus mannitoliphagus]NEX19006.1 diguanylate cyclase [Thiorhodococcus mannitoliphagus]
MVKFWKRQSGTAGPEPESTASPASAAQPPVMSELEKIALDQLASVLRTWGEYAFDIDEIKASALAKQLENWSRHVLNATPVSDGAAPSAKGAPQGRRDWGGLRDFTGRIRRSEQAYVNRQVVGTRQVMGNFVETLGQVLAEDQDEQGRVMSVLNHLRRTIEQNAPVETLTAEATHAIDMIAQIARERAERNKGLLADLTEKLQSLRGELDAAQHEMELDPLTRLFNRKAFDIQLERVFELCKLSGQPACLLMVDADHFKQVNDVHGHQVGDVVLRQLADCCAQGFPRKTDFVARYGGEEFAIVLQDTPLATAQQLTERLLESIRSMRIPHASGELSITASIGVAELKPHPAQEQWLHAADTALYQAKRSGRDRVSVAGLAK